MTMTSQARRRLALASVATLTLTLAVAPSASGHGGGGHGGGGHGGFGGGHAPSFSAPRAVAHSAPHAAINRSVSVNRSVATPHGTATINRSLSVTRGGGGPASISRNITVNRVVNVHGAGWGWRAPYAAYHRGWVNGYWNANYGGAWLGWGLGGFALGAAAGLMTAWAFNPMLYGWGYMPYMNPYYAMPPAVVVQQPIIVGGSPMLAGPSPYNYSQPLNVQAPPPTGPVADAAVQTFEAARAAFKMGDYARALQGADQALVQMPNDPTLHEFRALALFAIGQYEQAAAPLYAVLSVGPGWNWTTMVGLYPSADAYTSQLRALENDCKARPDSAPRRFVLAYHYLSEGHPEAAADQLREVVRLRPEDRLSVQLLNSLTKQDEPTTPPPAPELPAASSPTSLPAIPPGRLAGTWSARPTGGAAITLTIAEDGNFTWQVADKGQTRQFRGTSTFGNSLLTLAQSDGNALVGRVAWRDADHFDFKALGGGPGDPGLTFAR